MSRPKVLLRSSQEGSEGFFRIEGVVAQWSNPLTLQPEQSDGVGSICGFH